MYCSWKLRLWKNKLNNEYLEEYDRIVTDKISTIDGKRYDDIIDRINYVNKHREQPMKLILVGDTMQLPPVEVGQYGTFFHGAHYDNIHQMSYICKLTEVKRQENKEFIVFLD